METSVNCEGADLEKENSALRVTYFLLTSFVFSLTPVHQRLLPVLSLPFSIRPPFTILAHKDPA